MESEWLNVPLRIPRPINHDEAANLKFLDLNGELLINQVPLVLVVIPVHDQTREGLFAARV